LKQPAALGGPTRVKAALLTAIFGIAVASANDSTLLWRDTGPVQSLDLAAGPGGSERAPRPPFTFVKEDPGGTTPKVTVRDARGITWSVKFGPEAKPESFATRFAWASGYFAEPAYFLREGEIEGAAGLGRAAQFIQNGRFQDARFELRDEKAYRLVPDSHWSLDDDRLKGTKELAGLKLVLMLVSNWDVKQENFSIMEVAGKRYYAVTDWGASMGRTGDITGRSKWDCPGFALQSEHFVDAVGDGFVTFNYAGKERDAVSNNIRVDDVKWLIARVGKLSHAQIQAGLAASGASPEESACFANALGKRLSQLAAVASGEPTVTRTRTVTKTTTTTSAPKP
jgi:hypothetical protein